MQTLYPQTDLEMAPKDFKSVGKVLVKHTSARSPLKGVGIPSQGEGSPLFPASLLQTQVIPQTGAQTRGQTDTHSATSEHNDTFPGEVKNTRSADMRYLNSGNTGASLGVDTEPSSAGWKGRKAQITASHYIGHRGSSMAPHMSTLKRRRDRTKIPYDSNTPRTPKTRGQSGRPAWSRHSSWA